MILVMARIAEKLAWGGAVGLLATAVLFALLGGVGAGLRALLGGATAGVVGTGILSWLSLPMDLITLPLSIGTCAAGAAIGVLGSFTAGRLARLGVVLAGMAAVALLVPYAGLQAIGAVMLAGAAASWVTAGRVTE